MRLLLTALAALLLIGSVSPGLPAELQVPAKASPGDTIQATWIADIGDATAASSSIQGIDGCTATTPTTTTTGTTHTGYALITLDNRACHFRVHITTTGGTNPRTIDLAGNIATDNADASIGLWLPLLGFGALLIYSTRIGNPLYFISSLIGLLITVIPAFPFDRPTAYLLAILGSGLQFIAGYVKDWRK